ncbi:MAG: helix-turn-helix transcriptional regulator [Paracoccaceae bacterium]
MSTQFAFDLRLARRKAGLTQDDVAHLLGGHQSVVSDLERGTMRPAIEQIVLLSVLYGRSFESLFSEVMVESQEHLTTRLSSLPAPAKVTAETYNRKSSLRRLKGRLADSLLERGRA